MLFRMRAQILSKLLQLGIGKVRMLSAGWDFILEEVGTAELIAEIPGSRMRTWFLLCTISLQFLSEL